MGRIAVLHSRSKPRLTRRGRKINFGFHCRRAVGSDFMKCAMIAAMFLMTVQSASALEVYRCNALEGKSARVGTDDDSWRDNRYGPATILLDADRFMIAGESYVPEILEGKVTDYKFTDEVTVTSRDDDHVMGVVVEHGSIHAFQFHRPTKTLTNVTTYIDRMSWAPGGVRGATSGAFIAQCR